MRQCNPEAPRARPFAFWPGCPGCRARRSGGGRCGASEETLTRARLEPAGQPKASRAIREQLRRCRCSAGQAPIFVVAHLGAGHAARALLGVREPVAFVALPGLTGVVKPLCGTAAGGRAAGGDGRDEREPGDTTGMEHGRTEEGKNDGIRDNAHHRERTHFWSDLLLQCTAFTQPVASGNIRVRNAALFAKGARIAAYPCQMKRNARTRANRDHVSPRSVQAPPWRCRLSVRRASRALRRAPGPGRRARRAGIRGCCGGPGGRRP